MVDLGPTWGALGLVLGLFRTAWDPQDANFGSEGSLKWVASKVVAQIGTLWGSLCGYFSDHFWTTFRTTSSEAFWNAFWSILD